jgi:hypothetical protein
MSVSNDFQPIQASSIISDRDKLGINHETKEAIKPLINSGRSFGVLMDMLHLGANAVLFILAVIIIFKLDDNAKKTMVPYGITQKGDRLRLYQFNEADPVQLRAKNQFISEYATWMATSLHSYRWYLPGADGTRTPDPGAKVPGGVLPTAVFMATLSMHPSFSLEYQPRIAKLLIDKRIVDTRKEAVFKPIKTSDPKKVGDKWVVYVDGMQINILENGEKTLSRRYKKITIVAAPIISPSVAQKAYADPALQEAYMESASWGLMTVGIQDIDQNNQVTNNGEKNVKQ